MQFDAKIFGGLPVVVQVRSCRAEPDVGLPFDYFEIDVILTSKRRPIPRSWWQRLDRDGGLEALLEEAGNHH